MVSLQDFAGCGVGALAYIFAAIRLLPLVPCQPCGQPGLPLVTPVISSRERLSEELASRANLLDLVDRQGLWGHLDAARQLESRRENLVVDDGLLVARSEQLPDHPKSQVDEIDPCQAHRDSLKHAFVPGLCIGQAAIQDAASLEGQTVEMGHLSRATM